MFVYESRRLGSPTLLLLAAWLGGCSAADLGGTICSRTPAICDGTDTSNTLCAPTPDRATRRVDPTSRPAGPWATARAHRVSMIPLFVRPAGSFWGPLILNMRSLWPLFVSSVRGVGLKMGSRGLAQADRARGNLRQAQA